jgi:hypothetical protein
MLTHAYTRAALAKGERNLFSSIWKVGRCDPDDWLFDEPWATLYHRDSTVQYLSRVGH